MGECRLKWYLNKAVTNSNQRNRPGAQPHWQGGGPVTLGGAAMTVRDMIGKPLTQGLDGDALIMMASMVFSSTLTDTPSV